ncbi:hypothetical protein G6F63_016919 [Rhizopus arrhizus]|nr:hypothetical protein G6F63_016919 [Rhizopus arrhizus]
MAGQRTDPALRAPLRMDRHVAPAARRRPGHERGEGGRTWPAAARGRARRDRVAGTAVEDHRALTEAVLLW